jgi:ATP-dependent Clp endopeptidase proteolytic subunit ClpP
METHIYVYGQIGSNGITADFMRKKIANSGETITVHINSPGGEVYEGYTIYNLLRNSGKPINVIIEGLCASIATLIACAGDHIKMNPTAEFMIHNPMVGIEGDAEDLRKVADQLDNIKNTIIAAYKRKTKKSEEELWKMMDKETFLSSNQAMAFGFVDEVSEGLKMVAYLDLKNFKQDKPMDQKVLEAINKLGDRFEAFFKSKPKNLAITLEDGKEIFIETEDEILVGKAVFEVTPEGNIPLADGDHILADKRIIKVSGGIIESVNEPEAKKEEEQKVDPNKEVEDLKAQVADLTNKLIEKDLAIENAAKETVELKASVTEIKNEFEKVRNTVIGSGKDPKKVLITPKKDDNENPYLNNLIKTVKNK